MKKYKQILNDYMNIKTFLICIIFYVLSSCNSQLKDNDKSINIEKYLKCNSLDNVPENYKLIYECEKINQLIFPTKNVVTGKIFLNKLKEHGVFEKGLSYKIDSSFISSLIVITADSSNFSWGEIGTPYKDYLIEFYNKNGEIINQAEISNDGMLWIKPELKTTKWGLLSQKGENELNILMNKYITKTK